MMPDLLRLFYPGPLCIQREGETPSRQPAEPALSEVEGMPALLCSQFQSEDLEWLQVKGVHFLRSNAERSGIITLPHRLGAE